MSTRPKTAFRGEAENPPGLAQGTKPVAASLPPSVSLAEIQQLATFVQSWVSGYASAEIIPRALLCRVAATVLQCRSLEDLIALQSSLAVAQASLERKIREAESNWLHFHGLQFDDRGVVTPMPPKRHVS